MRVNVQSFLAACAAIAALGFSGSASAQYKQSINTSDVLISGYNHDLRFGDSLLWNRSSMDTFSRYMNGNFDSSGNVLLGTGSTGNGAIWRLNASTGADVNTSVQSGNANARSVVQIGSVFYYGTGSGNISASTGALNDGSVTSNSIASSTVSLVTDGTNLFAGGSGDDSVRRFTVSGETVSAATHTSASVGADVRGMQYFNGRIYVSTGSGGTISIFDASNLNSLGTLSGTTPGFNNEGFSLFSLGGKDWYVGAEMVNAGSRNALVVRELTSFNALSSTADHYRYAVTGGSAATAFNLVGNNDGLTGLSIDPVNGVGYFGSNSNAGVWKYTVSVVPEPSSMVLAMLGAFGLYRIKRRRRKTAN